jgi:hypothetical protein
MAPGGNQRFRSLVQLRSAPLPQGNRKETALVIYTDGRIRPVITPDDPALVAGELTAHGVNVTKGRERGFI